MEPIVANGRSTLNMRAGDLGKQKKFSGRQTLAMPFVDEITSSVELLGDPTISLGH